MKKKATTIILLAGALLMASCQHTKQENMMLTQRSDSLVRVLSQRNAELESALATIGDIQAGFDSINVAEGRISMPGGDGQPVAAADKLKDDMEYIRQTMDANRKRIAQLQAQLKSSNNKNASLQRIVDNLNSQLAEKTARIAQLEEEVAKAGKRINELDDAVRTLTGDVDALQKSNADKDLQILEQDIQLNRAWYVYGTSRELKDEGILKNGKVLHSDDFNSDYFTPVDIRHNTRFPLHARRAELLTTHPAGSWQLTPDENRELTLEILDPTQFWSVSRYLVIKVR